MIQIRRRTLLAGSGAGAFAGVLSGLLFSPTAFAVEGADEAIKRTKGMLAEARARRRRVEVGRNSANGWRMERLSNGEGRISQHRIPGLRVGEVAMRDGDVAVVLTHVVRRFHYEIDALRPGDVQGWVPPRDVTLTEPRSNLASGTAVEIRPGHYPRGAEGGFFPLERIVIRDILGELDGVVRWGGDDEDINEALFYVDPAPEAKALKVVAGKLRGWAEEPAVGAGTLVDPLERSRRSRARAVEKTQRN